MAALIRRATFEYPKILVVSWLHVVVIVVMHRAKLLTQIGGSFLALVLLLLGCSVVWKLLAGGLYLPGLERFLPRRRLKLLIDFHKPLKKLF